MVMMIMMVCPECGADRQHDITYEILNELDQLVGYVVHCRSCEHVWEERLRH